MSGSAHQWIYPNRIRQIGTGPMLAPPIRIHETSLRSVFGPKGRVFANAQTLWVLSGGPGGRAPRVRDDALASGSLCSLPLSSHPLKGVALKGSLAERPLVGDLSPQAGLDFGKPQSNPFSGFGAEPRPWLAKASLRIAGGNSDTGF